MTVDQEGSIKFNPYKLFEDEWEFGVAIEDTFYGEEPPKDKRPSLVFRKTYDITGRVKLSGFNPLKLISNPRAVVSKYKFKLRTDHYTLPTHRKRFSNNFEFHVEYDGKSAFFYSFEVPLR